MVILPYIYRKYITKSGVPSILRVNVSWDGLDLSADRIELVRWCKSRVLLINSMKYANAHWTQQVTSISLTVHRSHVCRNKRTGVTLMHDLKATVECSAAAAKWLRAGWLLHWEFKCFDEMSQFLRSTYVRRHLKYHIQAAGPYHIENADTRVCSALDSKVKGLPKPPTMNAWNTWIFTPHRTIEREVTID